MRGWSLAIPLAMSTMAWPLATRRQRAAVQLPGRIVSFLAADSAATARNRDFTTQVNSWSKKSRFRCSGLGIAGAAGRGLRDLPCRAIALAPACLLETKASG